MLVCWTAVDGELVRGALLPTLALKYKYRVHAVPLSTQPDTCEYTSNYACLPIFLWFFFLNLATLKLSKGYFQISPILAIPFLQATLITSYARLVLCLVGSLPIFLYYRWYS